MAAAVAAGPVGVLPVAPEDMPRLARQNRELMGLVPFAWDKRNEIHPANMDKVYAKRQRQRGRGGGQADENEDVFVVSAVGWGNA